jgi:hypothetical protein
LRAQRVTATDSRPSAWDAMATLADDSSVVGELTSWLEVQLVGANRVVIKDPRLPWFLPLWRGCAASLDVPVSFATMLRPPTEAIGSARQWYGTWQVDASRAAGWANVMLRTEMQTRGAQRAFVRYDGLLTDWRAELARVMDVFDLPGLLAGREDAAAEVDGFIDPSLRRQSAGWEALEVPAQVREIVDGCWQALGRLAETDDAESQAALDTLRADYDRMYADAEAVAQSSIRAARRKAKATAPVVAAATPPKPEQQPKPPARPRRRWRRRVRRVLRRFRRS